MNQYQQSHDQTAPIMQHRNILHMQYFVSRNSYDIYYPWPLDQTGEKTNRKGQCQSDIYPIIQYCSIHFVYLVASSLQPYL